MPAHAQDLAEVLKIQAVLACLERAVAVSQLAELVRNSQPPASLVDRPWQAARQQLLLLTGATS